MIQLAPTRLMNTKTIANCTAIQSHERGMPFLR